MPRFRVVSRGFSVSIHPLEHGLKWSDLAFLRIFIGKLDDCEVSFK